MLDIWIYHHPNNLCLIFSSAKCDLFEKQNYREKNRGRERNLLLVNILPLMAINPSRPSTVVADTQVLTVFHCLSRHISRKLGKSWSRWDLNRCAYGIQACPHHRRWTLVPTILNILFFFKIYLFIYFTWKLNTVAGRSRKRETESERIFHSLVHSLCKRLP